VLRRVGCNIRRESLVALIDFAAPLALITFAAPLALNRAFAQAGVASDPPVDFRAVFLVLQSTQKHTVFASQHSAPVCSNLGMFLANLECCNYANFDFEKSVMQKQCNVKCVEKYRKKQYKLRVNKVAMIRNLRTGGKWIDPRSPNILFYSILFY
jgi:hypothetical protein